MSIFAWKWEQGKDELVLFSGPTILLLSHIITLYGSFLLSLCTEGMPKVGQFFLQVKVLEFQADDFFLVPSRAFRLDVDRRFDRCFHVGGIEWVWLWFRIAVYWILLLQVSVVFLHVWVHFRARVFVTKRWCCAKHMLVRILAFDGGGSGMVRLYARFRQHRRWILSHL